MKLERTIRVLPFLIAAVYFGAGYDLPFWGDSVSSVSKAAIRIYSEGLDRPWNYVDTDPGHPTLFPWLIALFWRLLGYELWVPHALVALCSWGILYLIREQLKIFETKWQLFGLLLSAVSPLFISQSIEVSLSTPLTLAFLFAARSLKRGQYVYFSLAILALPLIHLQGVLLVAALGLYDLLRHWPTNKHWWMRSPLYLIPAAGLGIWLYFHYREFGWALVTPNYERASPSLKTIVYNFGISAWRLLDLGYFIVSIPLLYKIGQSIKKSATTDSEKLFVATFLFLCIGIPILFAYPPNHRYVYPVYLLLIPLFIRFLQKKKPSQQITWLGTAFVLLLSGNFWYYPGKCLGDQNLVFLNYQEIVKEMKEVLPEDAVLHSYAPLNIPSRYTHLRENVFPHYRDLYNLKTDSLDWVIESSLNCEYTPLVREELRQSFVARSFESYGVYVNVWMNKKLIAQHPDFATKPHEPSGFEKFIQEMKKRLKGEG